MSHCYTPQHRKQTIQEVKRYTASTYSSRGAGRLRYYIPEVQYPNRFPDVVHIDAFSARSGASLFLQERSLPFGGWIIGPPHEEEWWYNRVKNWSEVRRFGYALLEVRTVEKSASPDQFSEERGWRVLDVVEALDGFDWMACARPPWCMKLKPAVRILQSSWANETQTAYNLPKRLKRHRVSNVHS